MSNGLPGPLPGYGRRPFWVDLVENGKHRRVKLYAHNLRAAEDAAHRRFSATAQTIQTRSYDRLNNN